MFHFSASCYACRGGACFFFFFSCSPMYVATEHLVGNCCDHRRKGGCEREGAVLQSVNLIFAGP